MNTPSTTTSIRFASILFLFLLPIPVRSLLVGASSRNDSLSEASGDVGVILDREGSAARRPVLAGRWGPANEKTVVEPGDWLKTGARGANALKLKLTGGGELILGPGTQIEVSAANRVTLLVGELEVAPAKEHPIEVSGPRESSLTLSSRGVVKSRDEALSRLDADPRWLVGYKENTSTEALGSLLANIDGRNVPLTMGYHQVTVDVRDQIARTVIEESFENHTSGVLEGVFYFPLPADASISGFGMWIGDELVQGEIIEKQRAREIYETILREKRDPGLLEWAGGNLFKARVYPIGSEKRIRISYTQVLPKRGDAYRWNYALQSDLLKQHPLRRLRIEVNVSSAVPLASVESSTHECRVRTTEHGAKVEFEADEYVPDRDFELRVITTPVRGEGAVTLVPHRRGDDGYFMLSITPPASTPTSNRDASAPLDLIVIADTSGSMQGAPRANQLSFLESLLGALGEKDRFNLLTSDVESHWAFDESTRPSAASRDDALRFVEQREPLGWTNLDDAFRQASDRAAADTHVVYIGDGQPTAGDPDPAAFVNRLRGLYRGKGNFHVVVPGTTGEAMVWNAIAALGNGSVRSLVGGTDPASVAFELLEEITSPAVKNLTVSFEGMSVAAVYPERLPNLPAGRQQIVVGRFDPIAGGTTGRVVVRGVLEGRVVELDTPISIDPNDEGNSFIPRLWARHHLDHLLAQGSTKEVRERVIAMSEDFQIITPYTSFLVLESDADRERFQVEKRLRMRDGEEFFTAGRDAVRFELQREQMQIAKGWRNRLAASELKGLSNLLRDETELLRQPSGEWGGRFAGEGGFALGAISTRTATTTWGAPGLDMLVESKVHGDELSDLGEPSEEEIELEESEEVDAEYDRNERVSADSRNVNVAVERQNGKKDRGFAPSRSAPATLMGRSSKLSELGYLSGGGGQRSSWWADPFTNLFTSVPAPRTTLSVTNRGWPLPVQQVLETLNQRTDWIEATSALEFAIDVRSRDTRGRESASRSRHLLAAAAWLQTSPHASGGDYSVAWLQAKERGILTEIHRLGQVRRAEAGDALSWTAPFAWYFGDELLTFANYDAILERIDDERVQIVFVQSSAPDQTYRVIVDESRRAVVEVSSMFKGKVTSRLEFGDLREAGGKWWPQTIRSTDGDAREVLRTTIEVTELTPAEGESRIATERAQRSDAILIQQDEPKLALARAAMKAGNGSLDDYWRLFRHFAIDQRLEEAQPYFDEIERLCDGRPGLLPLRGLYLQQQRRQAELLTLLEGAITERVEAPRDAERDWASYVVNLASGGNSGEERLALLDRIHPIYQRHPSVVDVNLQWERWRASALTEAHRGAEAFAQWESMARDYPYQYDTQTAFASQLAHHGRIDDAVTWLNRSIAEHAPWSDWELQQLRSGILDVLWNGYRLEQLVETVEAWLRTDPERIDQTSLSRYLTALVYLDREEKGWQVAQAWLDAAHAAELSTGTRVRAQAAIQQSLGSGYSFYYHYGYRADDERVEVLSRHARDFAHDDGRLDFAGQILTDWRYRQTDRARSLYAEMLSELEKKFDAMPVSRAGVWIGWLLGNNLVDLPQERIDRLMERAFARCLNTDEKETWDALGPWLRSVPSRSLVLRYHRARLELTTDRLERVAAVYALFQELLQEDWTPQVEEELFALFPSLEQPNDAATATPPAENLSRRISALYDLTTWMPAARRDAAMKNVEDVNLLARRPLAAARASALKEARIASASRLARFAATLDDAALRDWVAVERLYLLTKAKQDPAAVWTEAASLLTASLKAHDATAKGDGEDGEGPPLTATILAARTTATLAWLLTREEGDVLSERQEALFALLTRASDQREPLVDGDGWRQSVLLILGQTDALETLLRELFASTDPIVREAFGRHYAYLLAEQGKLKEAVATLESIERDADLRAEDYRSLASWQTALGDVTAARDADLRSFAAESEQSLSTGLWRGADAYQRSGSEPPPELDAKVPLRLIALFRKAVSPQDYLYILRRYYDPTKDYRLLESVAEGVIGHTAQGVYPFLEGIYPLLGATQEEAALDRLAAHVRSLRAESRTAIDHRALALLEFLCEAAASKQTQGAEAHVARARDALRAAEPDAWGAGEPLLFASFLHAIGKLESPRLVTEQMRLLRQAVGATDDEEERLHVAFQLASTYADYRQLEDAINVLRSALESLRGKSTRGLPESVKNELSTYSTWLISAGEYRAGEEVWRVELAAEPTEPHRLWIVEQLHELYRKGVGAKATVALGSGDDLYGAVLGSFLDDLSHRTNESHAAQMINILCELWNDQHRMGSKRVRDDAIRFAFSQLPTTLDLYQYRRGQQIVSTVGSTLRAVADARAELEFLTVRAETEPDWLRLQGQDFWRPHGYRLSDARRNAGRLEASLEARVLAIVLKELRDDLASGSARNRSIYQRGSSEFWGEKDDEFHRTAMSSLEARRDSGVGVAYIAEYLFHGLNEYDDAIDAMIAANQRDLLSIEARIRLCEFLQDRKRWAESVTYLDALIEDHPEGVEERVMRMRAAFRTNDSVGLARTLATAEVWFRGHDLWEEARIAPLATAAIETQMYEKGGVLIDEAIALHVKSAPNRGVGDGVLSGYYRQKAGAMSGLGRTDDAVDAAAGAIVSTGSREWEREQDLQRLRDILIAAKDLDAYVERLDAEVRATQLENPIVRSALGQAYLHLKRNAEGAKQLRLAADAAPNDDQPLALLVTAYDRMKRPDLAAAAQLELAERRSREPEPYFELASRYEKLGEEELAMRARTQPIEGTPEETEGYQRLAEWHQANRRPAAAVELWRQVMRIREKEPTGILGLARCWVELKRYDEARPLVKKLLATTWESRFGNIEAEAKKLLEQIPDAR